MVEEKFLLDANIFITPYKNYYPFDFAPSYWEQLLARLSLSNIAVLDLAKNEVSKGEDELSDWINNVEDITICSRVDSKIIENYSNVLTYLQNSSLYTDKALRAWSQSGIADPWLIAAGAAHGYTLVTFEESAGKITTPSGKPKIPDIARHFEVRCVSLFYFMRKLKFKL